MRSRKRNESKNKPYFKLTYAVAVIIFIYIGFVFVRSLGRSIVLRKVDRINVAVYGEEALLLSFGLTDNVHYIVSFSHGDKVSVPGGYGRYAVGSLGKLASIEKDPELVARTFASMSSSYVDYYLFPNNSEVFEKPDTDSPAYVPSEIIRRLFSPSSTTNASLIDKLYLSYLIGRMRSQDFVVLRSISQENADGELEFSEKRFLKKYKGFFYHQTLREEGKELQILYNSYPGAVTLSRVIEGQGIRVVDLSNEEEEIGEHCIVRYGKGQESRTSFYLSDRFGCKHEGGDTEGSDIILIMGSSLTEKWK